MLDIIRIRKELERFTGEELEKLAMEDIRKLPKEEKRKINYLFDLENRRIRQRVMGTKEKDILILLKDEKASIKIQEALTNHYLLMGAFNSIKICKDSKTALDYLENQGHESDFYTFVITESAMMANNPSVWLWYVANPYFARIISLDSGKTVETIEIEDVYNKVFEAFREL